jgi:predicted aminopeptidase
LVGLVPTLVVSLLLSGCAQLGYLGQALGGHLRLLSAARPVDEWLAEPGLDDGLRERLQLAREMREFASRELALPDNASYRRYAELKRAAVVWNVVAAPELALTLKTWCYPVMGCAGYRGFFAREAAEDFATALRREEPGLDVYVYGVPAYSTLGWSNWLGGDPLLDTFIRYPEPELAGLIFHELAHQQLFAADDTAFNESYASAVEQLGLRAWLSRRGVNDAALLAGYEARSRRRDEFRALVARYRDELAALYASARPEDDKRAGKTRLLAALHEDYLQLKTARWGGSAAYDGWFASVNNASLSIQAAYTDLSPAFEALFFQGGRSWQVFHAETRRLAALQSDERRRHLHELQQRSQSQATPTTRRQTPDTKE